MFEGDNYFYNNEIEVCQETFNVALYERVSDADERKNEYDVESESITNQREFLTRYVLNKGWNIIDEYVDDGYTGTNFDRPAFQKMIRDIKQGIINLVIVKDYSRFGRNYSKAGYYLDDNGSAISLSPQTAKDIFAYMQAKFQRGDGKGHTNFFQVIM